MRRALLVLLVVGALALAGALAALLRQDDPGGASMAASEPASAPPARDLATAPDAAPLRESAREEIAEGPRPATAAGARILGRVVDLEGAPVPGARVASTLGGATTTGGDGAFTLGALSAGLHRLRADAEGLVQRERVRVRLAPGETAEEVMLSLAPGRDCTLEGRVVDADGRPVARATVQLRAPTRPMLLDELEEGRYACDEGGRFCMPIPPMMAFSLVVQHPGYAPFGRKYAAGTREVEVVLHIAHGIQGRVVALDDGAPLAVDRVTLLASSEDERGPWSRVGEAHAVPPEEGSAGRFLVPAVPYRSLRVVAEGPGFAPVASDPLRIGPRTEPVQLLLRARRGASLVCRAVNERGAPVEGAELRVRRPNGPGALVQTGAPFERTPARTDADGVARSLPLESGRYDVVVTCTGHFAAAREDVELDATAPAAPLELVLPRASAIRGALTSRGGGAPPRARAIAWPAEGEPVEVPVIDGAFEFAPLQPGEHTLLLVTVGDKGRALASRELTLAPGEQREVTIDLDALGGELYGVCTLDGAPLTRGNLTLRPRPEGPTWSCEPDRAGRYRFAGVPPGKMVLQADFTQDRWGLHLPAAVLVTGEEQQRFDLALSTGSVAGRLVDEAGQPLRGGAGFVDQLVGGERIRVHGWTADGDGRFELRTLPAGELLLGTALPHRENLRELAVRVAPGVRTELGERVLPATGSLVFHVRRRPGMATPSAMTIEARRAGASELLALREIPAHVRPRLDELPPGPLELLLRTEDGYEARATARVATGETRTVIVAF